MAGGIKATLADAKSSLALFKTARSSVQLQKAARTLQSLLTRLTDECDVGLPSQKLAANFFIEAFTAAFASLQVGGHC